MEYAGLKYAKQITAKLFGDIDIAGGIPIDDRPSPSTGPVYFEGKLILALSFQSDDGAPYADTTMNDNEASNEVSAETSDLSCLSTIRESAYACKVGKPARFADEDGLPGEICDRLRLWGELTNAWFSPSPEIVRFEDHDVVFIAGKPVYSGTVNNMREVSLVPGWDSTCIAINSRYLLHWKSSID